MTTAAASRTELSVAAAVAAIAADAGGGFLLDCPPGASHWRNRVSSWSAGRILSGASPVDVLTIEDGGAAADDALARFAEFLKPLRRGRAAIAVGFLSYDLGGRLERSVASTRAPDAMPLLHFALYDEYTDLDPLSGASRRNRAGGRAEAVSQGGARLVPLVRAGLAAAGTISSPGAVACRTSRHGRGNLSVLSDFTETRYRQAVLAAREYILAGDIFEVCLSQRFTVAYDQSPAELYMRLRRYNPAPYAAFFSGPYGSILSSSPELFLSVEGDRVVTRPIKGTARRPGVAPQDSPEDAAAAAALLASEKDNAELAMIIDLERNDLGRVCRYGSVQVEERARVETFARVHHLVSTVAGRLRPGASLADLLGATFPGGSISGAPKIRAMQIIDELEPCRRGVYTGSIGYVLPDGSACFNIAIRTMIAAAGALSFHAGGAVTAESDPAAEYAETLAKAEAMMDALAVDASPTPGDAKARVVRA